MHLSYASGIVRVYTLIEYCQLPAEVTRGSLARLITRRQALAILNGAGKRGSA